MNRELHFQSRLKIPTILTQVQLHTTSQEIKTFTANKIWKGSVTNHENGQVHATVPRELTINTMY